METILCAANKVECSDSRLSDIYLGVSHSHCFAAMSRRRELLNLGDAARVHMLQSCTQGFLTNKNRFVGRIESLRIAKKAGQIDKKHPPKDELLSEDIILKEMRINITSDWDITEFFNHLKEKHGFEFLMELTGMGETTVKRYLFGRAVPSLSHLMEILDKLDYGMMLKPNPYK